MSHKKIFTLALLTLPLLYFSQRNSKDLTGKDIKLSWSSPLEEKLDDQNSVTFLGIKGASFDATKNNLPFLTYFATQTEGYFIAAITDLVTESIVSPQELEVIEKMSAFIGSDFTLENSTRTIRKNISSLCTIVPIRRNANGGFEKLVSFKINWKPDTSPKKIASNQNVAINNWATSSVLSSGDWFKLAVSQSGVYKLDYNFLNNIGFNPAGVNPAFIKLYGNGGRMLSESNAVVKDDDLVENAIEVVDGGDGSFDNGDYILFYGSSPNYWIKQTASSCMRYRPRLNIYSDSSYYFLTVGTSPGKRVQLQAQSSSAVTHTVTSFDDYAYYESNNINLIKTGREWYGEYFDILTSYSFNFNFSNIVPNDTVQLEVSLANRMGTVSTNPYTVFYPGGSMSLTSPPVSITNYTAAYASNGNICTNFITSSPTINITVTKNSSSAVGWLNYIRLNARRQLLYTGGQMSFRDSKSQASGNVSKFIINGGSTATKIWDVTDLTDVSAQQFTFSGSSMEFTQSAAALNEYVIFNPASAFTPAYSGRVVNQNLHAYNQADFIIVSHPLFLGEAQRLADYHAQVDSLSYVIVTPQQCYNEFSSGSQDPAGIREFVRMLYNRASNANDLPKYLLLFGDGSYRYKGNTGNNTNFVPAYQSAESLLPTSSYTSDDFYGLLDSTEGDFTSDAVDIGIGRIPSRSIAEAKVVVDKIFNYVSATGAIDSTVNSCGSTTSTSFGDWRNWLCFIADDEDNGLHLWQVDSITRMVRREHPTYNFNKLYLDAYKQISTPGGQRYPDVNREIDKQVERGCLVINYTGHGGELGLAHESVLNVAQILGYTNINALPLWFTATCEFSRFDDPDRTSAGEYVLLNPNGGGVALFSTVRLVYATSNFNLSLKMWQELMDSINGKIPAMGEIFMRGKQMVFNDANTRNFTLLGDPALKLAYPRMRVITDSVNGVSVNVSTDTLKALSKVTIKGHISDALGNKLTNFNGIIYPSIFDKPAVISSLSNDATSPTYTFSLQKNIIYRGKSSVKNGEFTISFIVPKDIAYNFGKGKFSLYAHNGYTDATGYYEDVVVGGTDTAAIPDLSGPLVKLYMNDSRFVSGGTTNENPKVYAEISDSSGINTVGNGIGHDLVAILDNNSQSAIVLNDYYQADMNSYQSGKILYSLSGLSEGTHSLSLKVWDVQNNSSTAYTEFVVAKTAEMALTHVLNYPNPFTTKTQFFLEHNQCCSSVDVVINVFTISGKVVKSISKTLGAQGFRSEGIDWDGRDDYGDKLGKGVYIYKVKVRDQEGRTAEQIEKLVILN